MQPDRKAKIIHTTESEYVCREFGPSYMTTATAIVECENGETHSLNRGSVQCPSHVSVGDEGMVVWGKRGAYEGWIFIQETE